jgi:hypothetical protein
MPIGRIIVGAFSGIIAFAQTVQHVSFKYFITTKEGRVFEEVRDPEACLV